jgi:PilZ domain-containing protein
MFMIDASSGKRNARREQRFPVDLAAVLRGDEPELAVRLLDMSRGGARGSCPRPPAASSEVVLVRGALTVEARVAWSGRGRFGLQFARPIRATELLVQLSQSRIAAA